MGVLPFMDGIFHGKSYYKWMMTGGSPISGNLHIHPLEYVSAILDGSQWDTHDLGNFLTHEVVHFSSWFLWGSLWVPGMVPSANPSLNASGNAPFVARMWQWLLLVALLFHGGSALDCSATTPLQQVAPQGGTVQCLGSVGP